MESLDALSDILNSLADKPYDFSLHAQHIRLAQATEGMEADAMEMMTQFLAAGDEIWLTLLSAKQQSVDIESMEGVEELLEVYTRAENDYLSIAVLQKHLEFLLERHALYASGDKERPNSLGEIFSTSWTREAIELVVSKGVIHMTQGYKLWDAQRDWEIEMLETASNSDMESLIKRVQNLFLERLSQPHPNIEETFQSYSTFTTNFLPAKDYESILVAASKIRGQSVRNLERRERFETNLTESDGSLNAYNQYILYERRARHLDLFVITGVYERAIAEAAKRRFSGELGAEEALRAFWAGYCDALRILKVETDLLSASFQRAVRSVPSSGEVWARYLRFSERVLSPEEIPENLQGVPDIYNRVINMNLVQSDIDQLVPIVLSRAGYEKRLLMQESTDGDILPTLIGVLESGIEMARQASKLIDPKLRLENFLVSVYEDVDLVDSVLELWEKAAKHSKSSYQVWLNYTEALIKYQKLDEARQVFVDIHTKQLDWPEAIWEAWISFEHVHGSVQSVEACLDKIESAQNQINAKRAKEASKALIQNVQAALNSQANTAATVAVEPASLTFERSMDVDVPAPPRGVKRSAGDEPPSSEVQKKARIETGPAPLRRDRENSTVFVADLPQAVIEDDLNNLFKDCGTVREIKVTQLPSAVVATVEFFDRESVPVALTKDKKKVRGQEVSVHLAWRSTLYVTNFPESADDAYMRNIFSNYGTIFDIRWPSKKFKNTRRFCYVQYISPDSAQNALELHERELEPNLPLNVYISNPERKKERTDQDANEREVHIAGLSKYTRKEDLEKLFAAYGQVKEVRMATEDDGQVKGFAFVEFEESKDAQSALAANNSELKKRRIAVTLSDPRARTRPKSGSARELAETLNKSVRIKNLPQATQEGLLQQMLEKIAVVKRVEVFHDVQEAVVELGTAADASRLVLRTGTVEFGGNILNLSEEPHLSRGAGPSRRTENATIFKPRGLGPSKPKAGLGFKKSGPASSQARVAAPPSASRNQDAFREMLQRK